MTDPVEVTGDHAERIPRRWLSTASVVLLVVAVGAVAFALVQRSDATDLRERSDRRREAVLVATGFVEALISYDFEDLDAQQTAVEGFVTDEFRADYTDAFTNEVRDQIVAEKARSTVTIQDVWITADAEDEASAIVHALSTIDSEDGATAVLESYLRVRLVRLGERWKVDDLTSLGSRDLSAPLPEPGSDGGGSEGGADG